MASRLERIDEALKNPNVQAFLNMISAAEGTDTHGYFTEFGGGKLASIQDHPRVMHDFTTSSGKKDKTTAAGRYQFIEGTFDEEKARLKLPDFSPLSQDRAAVSRLIMRGALDPLLGGDFQKAMQLSGKEWASLPSSPYDQPKRSVDFVMANLPANQAPTLRDMTAAPAYVPQPQEPFSLLRQQIATGTALPQPAPGPALKGKPPSVSSIFDALKPQAVKPVAAPQPLPGLTDEEEKLLGNAVRLDTANARDEALAKFFDEPYTPSAPLPGPLDDSINRYLALL